MGYNPITPAGATLYARFMPQNGDCYTDAGGTVPALLDNDSVLAIRAADTGAGKLLPKRTTGGSTQAARLRITNGVKRLQFLNSAITTASDGAAFTYASDTTFDPGNCTTFLLLTMNRQTGLLNDTMADLGNSLVGSVNQIVSNSWWNQYNGSTIAAAISPFISCGNYPCVMVERSRSSGGISFWRHDLYNASRSLTEINNPRNVVSNPTATGITLGGRNALTLFLSGDVYLFEVWAGQLTNNEVQSQVAAILDYWHTQLGVDTQPSGSMDALIVVGDSNAVGVGTSQRSASLGGVAQAGLVGTYPGLHWYDMASPSRQIVHTVNTCRQSAIDAFTATMGRGIYLASHGENDQTAVQSATVLSRATADFAAIKASCPWVKTVWIEPPNRGDTDTSVGVAAVAAALDSDPSLGGVLDAVYRTSQDSILSLRATFTGPNATYVQSDKVHFKDAAISRIWNGTDASQSLRTILTNLMASAQTNHGQAIVSAVRGRAHGINLSNINGSMIGRA